MKGFSYDVLKKEIEQFWGKQTYLIDADCGHEIDTHLIKKERTAGGLVQCIAGLDEVLLYAESPQD